MKLELYPMDLKTENRKCDPNMVQFDMFEEAVQAMIVAVGQAIYFPDSGKVRIIRPPEKQE